MLLTKIKIMQTLVAAGLIGISLCRHLGTYSVQDAADFDHSDDSNRFCDSRRCQQRVNINRRNVVINYKENGSKHLNNQSILLLDADSLTDSNSSSCYNRFDRNKPTPMNDSENSKDTRESTKNNTNEKCVLGNCNEHRNTGHAHQPNKNRFINNQRQYNEDYRQVYGNRPGKVKVVYNLNSQHNYNKHRNRNYGKPSNKVSIVYNLGTVDKGQNNVKVVYNLNPQQNYNTHRNKNYGKPSNNVSIVYNLGTVNKGQNKVKVVYNPADNSTGRNQYYGDTLNKVKVHITGNIKKNRTRHYHNRPHRVQNTYSLARFNKNRSKYYDKNPNKIKIVYNLRQNNKGRSQYYGNRPKKSARHLQSTVSQITEEILAPSR